MVAIALALWGLVWGNPINIVSSDIAPSQPNVLASAGVSTYRCGIIVYDKFHVGEKIDWQIVVDHEVGHCIGLNHIPQEGIMNASLTPETRLTIWDWVEFWHHYPLRYGYRMGLVSRD